jgi:ribosomal protein S6--L-glutamate ligase
MKLGILMAHARRDETNTGAERLIQAGQARGHAMTKICESALTFSSDQERMNIFNGSEPLEKFDALIYRPNFIEEPGIHAHNLELLKRAGYKILNGSSSGMAITRNKLAQHIHFSAHDIPLPRWAIANGSAAARQVADKIGFPLIIKVAFGTHGTGVFFAENPETFWPIAEYLHVRDGNPMIVEEFIREADRKDLRIFIVQGQIAAAMERSARTGDVRANTSIGGQGRPVILSEQEKAVALKTAATLDLEILGVDVLRSSRGPLIMEVNSNPGFQELEKVTSADVAGAIIQAAETLARR